MSVKKYVFASRAERNNYEKLSLQWGEVYRIQPNLPFLSIFSLDDLRVDEEDAERLKKTSVDYTLCSQDYCPIMCIEFDGLYDGVNIGTKYFPSRQPQQQWRGKIMNLKLNVAHESNFPFFVVGTDQFEAVSPTMRYTIVDGIIGDVLAHREFSRILEQGVDPEGIGIMPEDFENLPREERYEAIQEWITNVEVQSDLDNNPIRRAAAELDGRLRVRRWGWEAKHFPELGDGDSMEERIKEIEAALYIGSSVTVTTEDYGDLTETVMLPNFKGAGFGGALHLSIAIAQYICLSRLAKMRESNGAEPSTTA